jgi:cysteine desulfurase/selenocysteine lyase
VESQLDQDTFATVRNLFPGALAGPYLDVAARGLLYPGGRAAIDAMLDQQSAGTLDKKAVFAKVEETRALFAALIRATPDEIAYTSNVTDGIATFAAALPWQTGDNVVLCDSLEHPANIFPWYGLGPKFGVEVKSVPQHRGAIPLDRILAAIDERTRVVTMATVSFAPGFRAPVAELGRHCRERGVLLIVDAAQSIGILDTDVNALQVDALAASTQKGLMALYGLGFLYIRAELADRLEPVYLSRFGVDLGDGHEAASGDAAAYRLAKEARRFDVGNYNYMAAAGVCESIRLLLELGPRKVEDHVLALAKRFARQIEGIGLPVYGRANDASNIVMIGKTLGFEHDSSTDAEMTGLYDHLTANGVRLGIRRDLLRFSFGIYNNEDDVERVVSLCQDWVRTRPMLAKMRV